MEKLDETLRAWAARSGAAAAIVPVIVTLVPGVSADGLAAAGLAIRRRFSAIDAVAGTIAAADLEKLAARPEVARIEHDGEVRALDRT